ncbi:MAG TPA: ADOP family duplicated permease [Bryobacteraceae bacterium]|jgi:predicted permease
MMGRNEILLRLRALFRRRDFERDVEDEIAFHLAMRQQNHRDQGMDDVTAQAAAHLRFGNTTRIGEALREMRGWGWIEGLWQDVRFALRQIRLNRGFAAGAILPLALAIGCTGAVFSLVDAILFRPTGVTDPAGVAAVYTFSRGQSRYLSDSYPDFRDISALDNVIESAAAYLRTQVNVRQTEGVQPMNAEMVTGDYFRAAGIAPALGRPLGPADDRPGAAPVALASYSVWENRYQRSPSILGATVWIDGVSFTIVGVMPKGYQGMLLDWYSDASFWLPLAHFNRLIPQAPDYQNHREDQMLMMLARLRPGATLASFQAALDALASRVAVSPDFRFLALPSSQARFFPAYRAGAIRFLWLLIAISGAALAIACFNLASLLLARAAARQHEISARLALGAGRFRLVRQFLIENGVLAVCACAASLPLAMALTAWYPGVPITRGLSITVQLAADWGALGFGMVVGLLTSVVAGIVPALRATRGNVVKRRKPSRAGLQDFFSAAQVACAMTALVCAALLGENVRGLGSVPLGYETHGVLVASADLSSGVNPSREAAEQLSRRLLAEVRVQSAGAALAWQVLPSRFQIMLDIQSEDAATPRRTPVRFNWVSDGYFELLHMPLVAGRGILPGDGLKSQPVVVVNRAAATLLWPGENPIGRHLRVRSEPSAREVVGVVEDTRYRPLGEAQPPLPYVFLPMFQRASLLPFEIHVRTPGEPLLFAKTLRRIVAGIAPDAPVYDIQTLDDFAQAGLLQMRAAAQAAGALSLLAIMLAVAGIFASGAYRVARQKKEIAIRIAIGAKPRRVIQSFAARGLWIGIAGACLGIIPAVWGVALLRSSVQGVGEASFAFYAAAGAILASAAALAALAAASRIARVQPADVLRVQ